MNCPSIISPELIKKLESTEEYKRDSAIKTSIDYLIGKIEELTEINSKLTNQNDEMSLYLKNINEKILKIQNDHNLLLNETKMYKTKLSISEKMINSLESTIREFNIKFDNKETMFNNKCNQFNRILNEYKNIIDKLKNEKITLDYKLNESLKQLNEYKEINEKILFENNKLNADKIALKVLNRKLKSYQILMYKLDLENQNFKKDIINYRNYISKITNTEINENNFPYQKINLNEELSIIDNTYQINTISSSQNLNSENENETN